MRELVDIIAGIMQVRYELVQDASRLRPAKSEIFRVSVDSSKADRLLGWRPTIGLEEGLRRTVAWMRERKLSGSG